MQERSNMDTNMQVIQRERERQRESTSAQLGKPGTDSWKDSSCKVEDNQRQRKQFE